MQRGSGDSGIDKLIRNRNSLYGKMPAGSFLFARHGRAQMCIRDRAWILASISGLGLVWYSFPLAELIGTVYFIIALRYVYRKEIKRLDIISEDMR